LRHFPWRECGYAVGALTLLLALYAGAYYAMVDPFDRVAMISSTYPPPRGRPIPFYSFGGDAAKAFFAPIHQVDRLLRPQVWEP
jgi:hypothetical protein